MPLYVYQPAEGEKGCPTCHVGLEGPCHQVSRHGSRLFELGCHLVRDEVNGVSAVGKEGCQGQVRPILTT